MKRFLCLLLVLLAPSALAQKPPINGVAGPTTSTQLQSIITDATGSGSLTFGTPPGWNYATATISAGTLTIATATAAVFNVTNNANITTFTITGATSGKATSFELYLTANGTPYTQAWGSSVKWASGVSPTITTTNGKVDRLAFETNDGGTTWYASIIGQNY